MKIDTNNAGSIIDALVKIIEKGTDYYTIETYKIDLSAYFEERHYFDGVKEKEIICPHVNNKRLWRRHTAKCRIKHDHNKCNKKCKTAYGTYNCCQIDKCYRELGNEMPDCNSCKIPKIERCGNYDDGKCQKREFKQQAERLGTREYSTGVYHPKRVFIKGTETLPALYKKLTIQAIYGWKFKEIQVAESALRGAVKDFRSDNTYLNHMLDEFDDKPLEADK